MAEEMRRYEQTAETTADKSGLTYCWAGVVALVVGLFIAGIIMGPLAIHFGSEGVRRGAHVFGTIVKLGGWVETILTAIGILAMILGGPR